MDATEVFKSFIVPFISVGVLPVIGWFALQIIKMGKEMVKLDGDVQHLRGNYAQSMEAINHTITEMRTDIKELLRRIYSKEGE